MEATIFTEDEVRELVCHLKALMSKVPLHAISTADEYAHAVQVLNGLLDAGGADEAGELAPLVQMLGTLIEEYETSGRGLPCWSSQEALRDRHA
ncbi:hypothetical protein [Paraburkholderia phosphatilytica]|uniref:hypothetical protein n=1 Tax=Paraburkholderia phosphatilytica TaxID=2282883 RepID=UPI000F5F55F7|nr:hypothetical protein [Paraburkholderia phosphatilytica]